VGMIPATMGCGHAFATAALADGGEAEACLLISVVNSFVIDWLLRLQVSNNIGLYHLYGLPFAGRTPTGQLADLVQQSIGAAARLIATGPELACLWSVAEHAGAQWSREIACLDVRERARLRADVDARVGVLYGLSAQEYARILSTFPLLDQDQPPLPGDCFIRQTRTGEKTKPRGFITRDLALLTFFELAEQPPPGDIVAFFANAGVDIERNTGPIRDLRTRVEEATRRGAVAYIPTQYKAYRPAETAFLPPELPAELAEDWSAHIDEHVVADPQTNAGEPTLAGTRIEARMVCDLLNQGWTFTQVLDSYPHLTLQQVAVAWRWGQLQ